MRLRDISAQQAECGIGMQDSQHTTVTVRQENILQAFLSVGIYCTLDTAIYSVMGPNTRHEGTTSHCIY